MPFDSIWLLVPVVVLFSGWMVYEHHRIDTSKTTAYLIQSRDTTLHEWMLGSIESTNGKIIAVYSCSRCDPVHLERRERG